MVNKEHLQELVERHGEVHVYVEEHETVAGSEHPIGVRDNQYTVFNEDCFVLHVHAEEHHIPYDSIVHVELPVNFPD
jgi:hypothetical protein